MKYATFLLDFPNGYHVSNFRISDANIKISSDVLYSAIIHEANDMGGDELVKKIHNYFEEGKLAFTDLFPHLNKEFLISKPKILSKLEEMDPNYNKDLKKIKFIPLDKLENFYNEKFDIDELKNKLSDMGTYTVSTKIFHKDNGEHEIYNLSSYKFNENNGLYFILAYEEDELLDEFDKIMYSLSYSGIGGKRTLGYGRFEYICETLNEKYVKLLENKYPSYMLISTSLPSEKEIKEIDLKNSYFDLIRKGGFIKPKSNSRFSENKRKKNIYLFDSGSIFKEKFNGEIFDVSLDREYPIYRYAKALYMGVDYDNI